MSACPVTLSWHVLTCLLLLSLLRMQPDSLGCFVQVAANWAYSLFFIMGGG